MRLIVQPDDGVAPLLELIKGAKESMHLAIFRFDHGDVEKALKGAMANGVKINTLIANVNRGGEKNLRNLEMRFLEAGMTVSRSGDDLIRHHDKIMIADQSRLGVLSFNFTHQDIEQSRGFGIITEDPKWVAEGIALFEADCKRVPYTCESDTFVVSPVNARKVLGNFLQDARKQLLIYDPQISDKRMIRILKDRIKAGVELRVIGQTKFDVELRQLSKMRLHTRTIIRDGEQAFIGSQSLRGNELDARREVGVIVREAPIVKKLAETFESDWASGTAEEEAPDAESKEPETPEPDTEKALEVLVKELQPITITVKKAVTKVVAQAGEEVLEDGIVKEAVKKVVKKVVKQAVKEAIRA